MHFFVDEVEVFFPYEFIYPEQFHYMCHLKRALDAHGVGVLEMPSGTGKTVSLLSLLVAYQAAHRDAVGKILYCSRTVAEGEKVLEEARRVVLFRHEALEEREKRARVEAKAKVMEKVDVHGGVVAAAGETRRKRREHVVLDSTGVGPSADSRLTSLVLGVTSRRNLCVHPRVSEYKHGGEADAACRSMTASWVRERVQGGAGAAGAGNDDLDVDDIENFELCDFYEGFEAKGGRDALLQGVFSHADLRELGRQRQWCPYFLARHSIPFADVVVWSYQYVIDARIAETVQREVTSERSIVIFDEAHNIDNVCIDALSIKIDSSALAMASRKCLSLQKIVQQKRTTNSNRLAKEYTTLVSSLLSNVASSRLADELAAPPVLPEDVVNDVVSGSVRKAEHFLALLRRFLVHVRMRITDPMMFLSQHDRQGSDGQQHMETPLAFLQQMYHATMIEPKVLQSCSQRLISLLNTLEISAVDSYAPLRLVADFATLVATYSARLGEKTTAPEAFVLLWDREVGEHALGLGSASVTNAGAVRLCCLDASLAMNHIIKSYRSVILTSGTMSPRDFYPKILGFEPVVSERLEMTVTRQCILPLVVTKGADQERLTTKHDARGDSAHVRNYGTLLIDICACVPDGVVCFFPSYGYMEAIVSQWHHSGVLQDISHYKLIFAETSDAAETALAMHYYRVACDSGRGAVLLAVSRGKVSEGIDFEQHYGRAVLCIGVPYQNTQSPLLRARLEYLRQYRDILATDFLTFDAMRAAAQCVGRVLRGKTDYGIMVFADRRFARPDKLNKLPGWIQDAMDRSAHIGLSSDSAGALMQQFLADMAVPWTRDQQIGKSLWSQEFFDGILEEAGNNVTAVRGVE